MIALVLTLAGCARDTVAKMSCDEVIAYLGSGGDWGTVMSANIDRYDPDFDPADCDTDPDAIAVTATWWKICGDYYDARQRLPECCPNGVGFPADGPCGDLH